MNISEVLQALDGILTQKKAEIGDFSQHAGGWEVWLQLEMTGKWSYGKVYREQNVWGDGRQIDLWFPETKFGVELKCLGLKRVAYKEHVFSDIDSTYRAFAKECLEDIPKVKSIPQGGTGIAVVIIPTWVPDDRMETLKKELAGETYQWMYMGNGGFIVGIHKSYFL